MEDKRLDRSRFLLLYRAPLDQDGLDPDSQEVLLAICSSTVAQDVPRRREERVAVKLDQSRQLGGETLMSERLIATQKEIQQDEIRCRRDRLGRLADPAAKRLTEGRPAIDRCFQEFCPRSAVGKNEKSAALWTVAADNPQPVAAVHTGVVPLVYKTQRELLASLRTSIMWATVLIPGVMIFVLRSPFAGLMSMVPNIFPIIIVFGALGWLGIKVDIGIMMTASVALGVAVDDTIHFVWWFRHGIQEGMDRRLQLCTHTNDAARP